MFSCPNCTNVIGQYPDAGVVTVVCVRCTFKYEVSAGTVKSLASRRVELRPASPGVSAVFMRRYELTIAISSRETLRFTFDTSRDDEWVKIDAGHQAVVVYSLRADRREALLFVVDRTMSERFVLAMPGEASKSRAVLYGVLASAAAAAGVAWFAVPGALVLGAALLSGYLTTTVLRRTLQPTHALASHERVELGARQELLAQKGTLLASRSGVAGDLEKRRALGDKLSSLRGRMIAVKLDAYASRIADIDRALSALDEQRAMDDRLLAEYDRTLQILDIEYEASVAADVLTTDSAALMESRLAELRVVEELRADVTRQLAANDEVEQLLRNHSS